MKNNFDYCNNFLIGTGSIDIYVWKIFTQIQTTD